MFLLKLTGRLPTNTALLNPDGKPLYTISTPYKWVRRSSTIFKHVIGEDGQPTDESEEIARIQWHLTRSSRMVFKGEIIELSTFLKSNKTRT